MPNQIKSLEKAISYKFKDPVLAQNALTHKSYATEQGLSEFNERMEFLGDSILGASVAEFLYNKYPKQDEGRLSQLKSQIVSRINLSKWAKEIKLGACMLISTGEEASGGRNRDSLLSNTMEAVIAAMYLDGGFSTAREFIFKYLASQKRLIVSDSKSKLQEYMQSQFQTLPDYKVVSESGPDHEKIFEIGVMLKEKLLGTGSGKSKKEAEQAAARSALREINKAKKATQKA